MRSCKLDPLSADIVHVREDGRDGASVAGRLSGQFSVPGGRVQMFDKELIHVIVGGKDLGCGLAELSVNLMLTRGHGSYSLSSITSRPSARRTVDCFAGASAIKAAPMIARTVTPISSPREIMLRNA